MENREEYFGIVSDFMVVFFISLSLFFANQEADLQLNRSASIPFDYMIICAVFFSVLPTRDCLKSGKRPSLYQLIFMIAVLIFGAVMLEVHRLSQFNEIFSFYFRFQLLTSLVYTISVLNLFLQYTPKGSFKLIFKNIHPYLHGLIYMILRSVPSALATGLTYKIFKYENAPANHATIFCMFLAIILLVFEGAKRHSLKN